MHAIVRLVEPAGGSGVTINVSDGGMRLAVDRRLEVGQICLLGLSEAGSAQRFERVQIVWCRPTRDGCVVGARVIGVH